MKAATKENAGREPGSFPESVHQATQSVPQSAAAGKALAVWLYNIGARSLGDTQAAFNRHPSWRSA